MNSLSFSQRLALKKTIVSQIFNLSEHLGDFHSDELDIDIELEALKFPERYPMKLQESVVTLHLFCVGIYPLAFLVL